MTGVWITIAALAVSGGLVVATLLLTGWRTRPYPAFVAISALALLSPTSSVLPLAEMVNEHRPYMPLALLSIASTLGLGRSASKLARRAQRWALGGLLLGLPLLVGQILTGLDYTATRDVRAGRIIDALQRHYEKEFLYPENLEGLVEAGELKEIPRPRIGFAFLSRQDFLYQGFGTSYVLEFSAPRWIQCAYNPPYLDEYEEEEEEELEDLGGSWSCPSKPPELW